MRMFLRIFVSCCIMYSIECCVACAESDKLEGSRPPALVDSVKYSTEEILAQKYEALLQKVQDIDPKFVKKLKKYPSNLRPSILRSFLAKKTFDFYKDYFLEQQQKKSDISGRKIKKSKFVRKKEKYVMYRLDMGALEDKQCKTKDGDQICYYPDGFEKDYVIIDSFGKGKINKLKRRKQADANYTTKLYVHTENEQQNDILDCSLVLVTDIDKSFNVMDYINEELMFLRVWCQTYDYNEYQDFRNNEITILKNGLKDNGAQGVRFLPSAEIYNYATRFSTLESDSGDFK